VRRRYGVALRRQWIIAGKKKHLTKEAIFAESAGGGHMEMRSAAKICSEVEGRNLSAAADARRKHVRYDTIKLASRFVSDGRAKRHSGKRQKRRYTAIPVMTDLC